MASDDKIRATFDSRDAQIELDRLSKGMDVKTRARLSGDLEAFFQDTQKRVHVLSGALRSSGRRYVRDGAQKWRGTVTYGGYSKVARYISSKTLEPRDTDDAHNVDYAAIENNLDGVKYGTPHHFFDEGDIQNVFDRVQQDVADWVYGDPKTRRRARDRTTRAAKRYTPRPK